MRIWLQTHVDPALLAQGERESAVLPGGGSVTAYATRVEAIDNARTWQQESPKGTRFEWDIPEDENKPARYREIHPDGTEAWGFVSWVQVLGLEL